MNEEVKSTAGLQSRVQFHTQFRVLLVMLIVEDPTVTLECRTAINSTVPLLQYWSKL